MSYVIIEHCLFVMSLFIRSIYLISSSLEKGVRKSNNTNRLNIINYSTISGQKYNMNIDFQCRFSHQFNFWKAKLSMNVWKSKPCFLFRLLFCVLGMGKGLLTAWIKSVFLYTIWFVFGLYSYFINNYSWVIRIALERTKSNL